MPDYEIKCWDESNFDLQAVPWVREAIEKKKWSLASDYIRHYAIYTEGGIYMDTDVTIHRPLDEFLEYDFFSAVEYHEKFFNAEGYKQIGPDDLPIDKERGVCGLGLLAALFGASQGNPFIKECMDYFGSRHFIREDGSLYEDIINPDIMALQLIKYGFKYRDEEQMLENNMKVFSSHTFVCNASYRNEPGIYAIHWADNSWRQDHLNWKGRLRNYMITHFPAIFRS
jgi:hypothetical protein